MCATSPLNFFIVSSGNLTWRCNTHACESSSYGCGYPGYLICVYGRHGCNWGCVFVGVLVVGMAVSYFCGGSCCGHGSYPISMCISGVVPVSSNARGCGDVGRLLLFANVSSTKIMASSSHSSTSLPSTSASRPPVPKPQHPASYITSPRLASFVSIWPYQFQVGYSDPWSVQWFLWQRPVGLLWDSSCKLTLWTDCQTWRYNYKVKQLHRRSPSMAAYHSSNKCIE